MNDKTTTGGFALTHDMLTSPPAHIPDMKGNAYKTELVLLRTPERTEKIIWWHLDDPRPEPHNHPWDFSSVIMSGGYSERRWHAKGSIWQSSEMTYRAGDINCLNRDTFHVVYDVQPKTVTRLLCGPATEGNVWGYLHKEHGSFVYRDADKDPGFLNLLWGINPHLRP